MAQRRMFSLKIVDTDKFLDMPISTQLLYFHLSMRADDDGFVSNPKKIQRVVGCSADDFKVLLTKNFIIPFDSGICVIKDWKIHNYIQNDRYNETIYTNEKSQLEEVRNSYEIKDLQEMDTECVQNVSTGKVRLELGKVSLGKDKINIGVKKFKKPTIEEVKQYCEEINFNLDCEYWFDFYESKNWMIGKNKMKNWKAAVRTWKRNKNQNTNQLSNQQNGKGLF